MLLTTLFLLTVSLLLGSFWGLLRYSIGTARIRENELRAYYAARGGVADVVDEIRQGHTWSPTGGLSPQWVHRGGSKFYKSSSAPTPLSAFDYPVTINVTLTGDPSIQKTKVVSSAEVLGSDNKTYSRTVTVTIIKTLSSDVAFVSGSE